MTNGRAQRQACWPHRGSSCVNLDFEVIPAYTWLYMALHGLYMAWWWICWQNDLRISEKRAGPGGNMRFLCTRFSCKKSNLYRSLKIPLFLYIATEIALVWQEINLPTAEQEFLRIVQVGCFKTLCINYLRSYKSP